MNPIDFAPQLKVISIIWEYTKKYIWIVFAITTIVFGYMLFNKTPPSDLSSQLETMQKHHEEELKAIRDADAEQIKQLQQNELKLKKDLEVLDESYKTKLVELNSQKIQDANKILKDTGSDPKLLAEALAKALDLQVK
jgi:hypothetical protein